MIRSAILEASAILEGANGSSITGDIMPMPLDPVNWLRARFLYRHSSTFADRLAGSQINCDLSSRAPTVSYKLTLDVRLYKKQDSTHDAV